MPKISVIIPTYNRTHLLGRAIQSVLRQTYQDFEIIIIDDASTDGTEKLVKDFNDNRIIFLRLEKNRGGSAARNTGIKNSSGEYIAFLDSDDEWLPEKLEKQVNVFNNAEKTLGVVYTAFYKENWNTQHDPPLHRGDIFNLILIKNFVGTTSTVLIRKECFNKAGVFDETLPGCQDWDMWIRVAQYYEFYFLNEILVKYYHQVKSITMDKKASVEGHKMVSNKYNHYLKTLPKDLQAEHYFNLGKNFWWKRNITFAIKSFAKSTSIHYTIIPSIINFLVVRSCIKLLRKI